MENNYYQYYIGQQIKIDGELKILRGVVWDRIGALKLYTSDLALSMTQEYTEVAHECRLILRSVNSMSCDEFRNWTGSTYTDEYCKVETNKIGRSLFDLHIFIAAHGDNNSMLWLMKNGFDVFGLIPSDLAETKL